MSKKAETREVNRSSITGRFVTERYAHSHPKTTETQHVKVPPQTGPKKGDK